MDKEPVIQEYRKAVAVARKASLATHSEDTEDARIASAEAWGAVYGIYSVANALGITLPEV